MLNPHKLGDDLALVRLLELCDPNSPWYRSLWGVGLELSLREYVEACDAYAASTLSDGSVKRLGQSIIRLSGADPALTDGEKSTLRARLSERDVPRQGGVSYHAIGLLGQQIQKDYLTRWADVVDGARPFSPERFAKCIAAHLLDKGFSSRYLHDWLSQKLDDPSNSYSLGQLCRALQQLEHDSPPRPFDILVAFSSAPSQHPTDWLTPAQTSTWLKANSYSTSGVRPVGAIVFQVCARDSLGGVEAVRNLLGSYSARASIGTGAELTPLPTVWVAGHTTPLSINHDGRGVKVSALARENLVFSPTRRATSLDAAVELLAHLENSSPTAAVAGGWAAIEGLLAEPNNRAGAADYLAALVACSVPRAELTKLANVIARKAPTAIPQLLHATTNSERSKLLATEIRRGLNIPSLTSGERAAMRRLKLIIDDPKRELQTLQEMMGDAFHRLYRQRNLVLHGGQISSVALAGSLRTVAKLAGAGIDRIVHGVYEQNLSPWELVARAQHAINTAQPATPEHTADLLG